MKKLSEIVRKEILFNCVYKIINTSNNKFYVGSCASKTFFYERIKHHQKDLVLNKHANKYLQRAYNKNKNSFYYQVIEVCRPEDCIKREQYWIDTLKPHYNLCKKAGSSFGRVCSKESKQRISLGISKWYSSRNGIKFRRKLSKLHTGKTVLRESIDKMLKSKEGFKHSKKTKQKMSLSALGVKKSKSHILNMKGPKFNLRKKVLDMNTGIIYNRALEVANKFGISIQYVRNLVNGKQRSKKYKFKYC